MRRAALVLFVLSLLCLPLIAGERASSGPKADLDVRLPDSIAARGGFVMRSPSPAQLARSVQFEIANPGLTLRWDGLSGSPKWVAARPGSALSKPGIGDPEAAARAFLRQWAPLLGIEPVEVDRLHLTSVVPAPSGGAHVHFKQVVDGIEVFDGRVNVNVREDLAVKSFGSRLYSGLFPPGPPLIDAFEAIGLALENVYPEILPPTVVVSAHDEGQRYTVFDDEGFGISPTARLVIFPDAEGARLAWDVHIAEPTFVTSYRVLIDAVNGSVMFRTNLTLSAEARVLDARYPSPETEEFQPGQHGLFTIPVETPESPAGWISGDGTSLAGNNASTHLRYLTQPGLAEPDAIYDYAYNTASSALVNAWWWVNDAHDRFYAIGFNEAAGNFQADNFGLGGTEGDAMRVVVNPKGPRSGGLFHPYSTDGLTSAISLYWTDCLFCADHDGYPENGGERSAAFSRDTIYHEYVHGVTTRMVGGPAAADCLNGVPQSTGLTEAWADVFASSFSGDPRMEPHRAEGSGWIRGLVHDLTYDDICDVVYSGCEEHGDGMIFAGALWDLRESMRASDPAEGLDRFHRIVLKGLAYTVCHPTMLDARDGILEADENLYDSAHHGLIRNVFAARGMGQWASSTGETDTDPVADYTVPAELICTAPGAPSGLMAAAAGDNAVALTFDATTAAAVEIWREDLDNSFDRPVRVAFTTNTAEFVDDTVQGGKSYRYHLVALGSGGVVCRSGESNTADATAVGACDAYPVFDPAPVVTVGEPGCALTLAWNAAQSGCPSSTEPIVYNVYRATEPGFEPSDRLLLTRTTVTSIQDVPPDSGLTYFYLVLAQHGTLDDLPDHRPRGSAQLLKWAPGLPTSARTTELFWGFDGGAGGWISESSDPAGGWVLVDPSPTYYTGTLLAPDEAAGGAGLAWVTGDAGGPSSVTANDCRGTTLLSSPVWDGTEGATILSFDYWAHLIGIWRGIDLIVDNGTETATQRVVRLMTAQPFETAGRHGWQRLEIDLATLVEPSSTMSVTFSAQCQIYFSEFGIDNVRIEQAASCTRPALFLQDVTVDDSPPGWGNGNGALEPGETALLSVDVTNLGATPAIAPRGSVSSDVRGMIIHEDRVDFPDIPPAGSASSMGPGFAVTAPPDWDCYGSLPFEFEFSDASGTTANEVWSLELGHSATETVFEDDFETDKGWIVYGSIGSGRWQRDDPIGTMDGTNQANPEDDSPNDAGTQCYVTENSQGGPNAADVDYNSSGSFPFPYLYSPRLDLTGYKRAILTYDLWFYDNSNSMPSEDYARIRHYIQNVTRLPMESYFHEPTNGWFSKSVNLHNYLPMVPDVRLEITAHDWGTDHIVEMGVDNVRVEGERVTCDALGVANPPNGIGASLRVEKTDGSAELSWLAAAIDSSHDGAAYYSIYSSGAPDSGFSVATTATATVRERALDAVTEYYLISSVNAAGTSGDEPAP